MAARGHALITTCGFLALWVTSRTVFALWPRPGDAMRGNASADHATFASSPLMLDVPPPRSVRTALAAPQRIEIEPEPVVWSVKQTALTARKHGAARFSSRIAIAPIAKLAPASAPLFERQILSRISDGPQLVPENPTVFAMAPTQPAERLSSLTMSTWALFRPGASRAALVDNGQLGGSQIGARVGLPIVRLSRSANIGLSTRIYAPIGVRRGKEAAIGVSLRNLGNFSVEIFAERRIGLDREGRNAFSVTAVSGLNDVAVDNGFVLNAYAQAGVVGIRARDSFVDGNVVVEHPLKASGARLGVGAWGGVQPGVARLDIGPQASTSLPIAGKAIRVSAQWRFRVAGRAVPASGPAVVIGTDF
jgi:hypothetical protein